MGFFASLISFFQTKRSTSERKSQHLQSGSGKVRSFGDNCKYETSKIAKQNKENNLNEYERGGGGGGWQCGDNEAECGGLGVGFGGSVVISVGALI